MDYIDGIPALQTGDPLSLTPEYTQQLRNLLTALPHAVEAGEAEVVGDGTSFNTVAVSLTPGRFTRPPIVIALSTTSLYFAYAQDITTTSFNAGLRHYNDTNWTTARSLNWLAVQMTPDSAAG